MIGLNSLLQRFGDKGARSALPTATPPITPSQPTHPLLPAGEPSSVEAGSGLAGMFGKLSGNPLFNMGLQLLAQDGYSTTPRAPLGARFAQAWGGAQQAVQGHQDRERQSALDAAVLKLKEAQAKREAAQARKPDFKETRDGVTYATQMDEDGNWQTQVVHNARTDAEREAEAAGLSPGTEAFNEFVSRAVLKAQAPGYMREAHGYSMDQQDDAQAHSFGLADFNNDRQDSRTAQTEAGATYRAELGAGTGQVVETPNGPMIVDRRTGQARPVTMNGQAVPSEATMKRQRGAGRVLELLGEAEALVENATGSYGGAALDLGARVVGKSTGGSQAIAKLKAIEGALLAEMPRMEGPQSNIDVAMYRQAAGSLGDPTIPAADKAAAIGTIKSIQQKYAGAAARTRRLRFNAVTGRVE